MDSEVSLLLDRAENEIFDLLDDKQKEFLEFVLAKYTETGIEELDQEKLPMLLKLKYGEISDASKELGGIKEITNTFLNFQKHLYVVNKRR